MHRICWQGLDKWTSEKKIAKFILEQFPEFTNCLLAKPPKKSYAFIDFPSSESMSTFVEQMETQTYKNRKIKLKPGSTQVKKKMRPLSDILKPKEPVISEEPKPLGPIEDKVTPLWQESYSQQLLFKKQVVSEAYEKFRQDMDLACSKNTFLKPSWLKSPPEVREVQASPLTDSYRNKVEFNIGAGREGLTKVGFTNGQMAAGNLTIDSPKNCLNIPESSKVVAELVEEVVRASGIPAYNIKTHEGIWKQVTYRLSSRTGQSMVIVQINPSDNQQLIEDLLVEKLSEHCSTLLLQVLSTPPILRILTGTGYITEYILEKAFRISPLSFFQVNTIGCEVLYRNVLNEVEGDVLLDICCGTGSIGICCSEKVSKVIGVEIIPEAIADAQNNAELNNVNAEFKVGKAEDLVREVCKDVEGKTICGVVDPPRTGLQKTVLSALRTTKGLDKLVYVSCNPKSMFKDLLELCLPEHKKLRGPPFVVVSVQPVDMFPHTPHVECVVTLKRITALS